MRARSNVSSLNHLSGARRRQMRLEEQLERSVVDDVETDSGEVETLPENDRVRYTISPEARKRGG